MGLEDFTLNKDDNGNKLVTLAESPTKTQQGVQPRSVLPKIVATGESRCAVAQSYLSKRPEDLKYLVRSTEHGSATPPQQKDRIRRAQWVKIK